VVCYYWRNLSRQLSQWHVNFSSVVRRETMLGNGISVEKDNKLAISIAVL
jgi:hypothetical protein